MRNHVFVEAQIGQFIAEILNRPRYTDGLGGPPDRIPVGDGTNRPHFMYKPENEVVLEVDPSKNAAFVRAAKEAEGDHTAPLLLKTEAGNSFRAVILPGIDRRQIRAQLAWWL